MPSHLKPASENVLDPVNLHRDVCRRYAGDLADGTCIQAFEIRENQLPVHRLQALDQPQKPLERSAAVEHRHVLLV
jgi:hypothetical protein